MSCCDCQGHEWDSYGLLCLRCGTFKNEVTTSEPSVLEKLQVKLDALDQRVALLEHQRRSAYR